ncbi:MAG: rod shape-determining protein MreC [candidate division Zixibacteria bacterium]|nr:rod shape-determining protein MreC [candidate division Zixibacteria bacterium]
MSWISTLFSHHWRNFHVSVVVILSVVLIFGPSVISGFVNQSILTGLYSPFFKIRGSYEILISQDAENMRLRELLTRASLKISSFTEALRENKRLRNALGFEQPQGYRLMPAEVISVSGYQTPTTAIINRGSDNTIMLNQPVINQDGLIGRISLVTLDFATVQLLTDPANRVAGRIASSREMGIVKYTSDEGMILDNFSLHGSIEVGDTVVSSGLGGVYPAGLTVGVVKSVERDEDLPFCRITLKPTANFHSIEELFVLKEKDKQ